MDAWHVQHRRLRHSLLAFLMVVAGGLCSGKATAADCAGTLTPLSACPKSADNNVEIGAAGCQHVVVDKSLAFSKITVDPSGELCVRDRDLTGQTLLLSADQIIVRGTLQIGSKERPIGGDRPANHVTIRFTGAVPKSTTARSFRKCSAMSRPQFPEGAAGLPGRRPAAVRRPGRCGARFQRSDSSGKTSWTYLSQPAGRPLQFGRAFGRRQPGRRQLRISLPQLSGDAAKIIHLADKVDWLPGDWVVIATTSFSPFETEFARIESVDATKTVLTLGAARILSFRRRRPRGAVEAEFQRRARDKLGRG